MATTASKTLPVPAVPVANAVLATKTVGKYTFEMVQLADIPEEALNPSKAGSNPMPFDALFSAVKHKAALFVPKSFWLDPVEVGGRFAYGSPIKGVTFTEEERSKKVNKGYQIGKLRDAFKAWQAKDKTARAKFIMLTVYRDGLNDTEHFPIAGTSLHFRDSTAK